MHVQTSSAALASASQFTETDKLVEQTLDLDPIQRYYAAKAIARLGPVDPAFVPALHHLLQDEEFNVRLAACDALGAMGCDAVSAVTGLCNLLKDSTIGVRESAARALHALCPLPAFSHRSLTLALSDFNPRVREHAAAALAKSQPTSVHVAIALRDALFDQVEAVRWYAAAGLGEMGSKAKVAIPALVTVYLEDVDIIKSVALDVIKKIAPNLDIVPIQRLNKAKLRRFHMLAL